MKAEAGLISKRKVKLIQLTSFPLSPFSPANGLINHSGAFEFKSPSIWKVGPQIQKHCLCIVRQHHTDTDTSGASHTMAISNAEDISDEEVRNFCLLKSRDFIALTLCSVGFYHRC